MFRQALDTMFAKALRTKSKYHQTTGQANSFLTQIANNADYKWLAESEGILQPARDAQAAISLKMTEFDHIMFSGMGNQDIKKQFADIKDLMS